MKVSIIIPVYNRERFLMEAVESVFATGHQDVEVLIVDDGSSDRTLAIADKLVQKEPDRVRLLRHPGGSHRGISESRNLGIRESSGELLCFLDSDDAYLPNRFDHALPAIQTEPDLDGGYEPVVRLSAEQFSRRLEHPCPGQWPEKAISETDDA